ncbi:MAG: DUF2125 domain-containing protein [Telmatospirillum sp.]|nr:DUF2125 domain-containing protein [Telmatospirillum sp.]
MSRSVPSLLRSRPRRLAAGALVFLGLAGAVYGFWWHHMAGRVRAGLERWQEQAVAAGWRIGAGTVDVGGFPGAIRVTIAAPDVTDPAGNRWEGPPVTLSLPLFGLGRLHADAAGRHRVTLASGRSIPVTVSRAAIDAEIGWDGPGEVSIEAQGVSADTVTVALITLRGQAVRGRPAAGEAWDLSLTARELRLPDDLRLPFGTTVTSARVDALIEGAAVFRKGLSLTPQALASWRDAGGRVDLQEAEIVWPPLSLGGTGSLSLDARLQPVLKSDCTLRGLFPALDRLVGEGWMTPRDRALAGLVLGLLARPGRDGKPELQVPVSLSGGRLSVGSVPILTVPELTWK